MSALRYGIIGCGAMGREHIENIQAMSTQVGGARVAALADTHRPSIDAALGICQGEAPVCFDDHRALLASDLCDIVVIATPNFTHAAVMRDALAAPQHILVEKPLVTRMDDGIDLLRRAKGRIGIVWVAQEYRYMPPVAELIRMAHAGDAGRIHQVAIREHRQPFYPKVGDWNRFSENTGGTLVEKCCHYFNLMDLILQEQPQRVFASGGQRVNHLDEQYGGRRPDILDSAFVIVEYASGARAMLDLCMFAENTVDNEHLSVVGDQAKIESLLPALTLRHGRRDDWGRPKVWGEKVGTGRGVDTRRIWDSSIRYAGHHFGASYVEHLKFAAAVREGRPAEIGLEEGLRAVATGLAAHKSIDEGRVVAMSEVLPAQWP
jgi:myo-inositol 2-dehydrogenase / D-chiro-inositol 1-dehydrogenase